MLDQKFDTLPDLSKSVVATKKVVDRKTKKRNISPPPSDITSNDLCLQTAKNLYEEKKPIRGQHNMSPARLKALNDLKKQTKSNKPVNMANLLGLERGNPRVTDEYISDSNTSSIPSFNINKTTYNWKQLNNRQVKLPSLFKDNEDLACINNGRTSKTAVGNPLIQCQ